MRQSSVLVESVNHQGKREDRQIAVIDGLLPLKKGDTVLVRTIGSVARGYRVITDPLVCISPESSESSSGGWVNIAISVEEIMDATIMMSILKEYRLQWKDIH